MHNTIEIEITEKGKQVLKRTVTNAVSTGYLYSLLKNVQSIMCPSCSGNGNASGYQFIKYNNIIEMNKFLYLINTKDTAVDPNNLQLKNEDIIIGQVDTSSAQNSVPPIVGTLRLDKCTRRDNVMNISCIFYENIANGTFNAISLGPDKPLRNTYLAGGAITSPELYVDLPPRYGDTRRLGYSTITKRAYYVYNGKLCSKSATDATTTEYNLNDINGQQMFLTDDTGVFKVSNNQLLINYKNKTYFYKLEDEQVIYQNMFSQQDLSFNNFCIKDGFLYTCDSYYAKQINLITNATKIISLTGTGSSQASNFATDNPNLLYLYRADGTAEKNELDWNATKRTITPLNIPAFVGSLINVYPCVVFDTKAIILNSSYNNTYQIREPDVSKDLYTFNCMTRSVFSPITKKQGQIMTITYALNFN